MSDNEIILLSIILSSSLSDIKNKFIFFRSSNIRLNLKRAETNSYFLLLTIQFVFISGY